MLAQALVLSHKGGRKCINIDHICIAPLYTAKKHTPCFFFVCPPEGGSGSSWLKHASKQRSPTKLVGVVRAVVVPVLERAFVVGGEVAVAIALVGAEISTISR
jgi:hypothetical protein